MLESRDSHFVLLLIPLIVVSLLRSQCARRLRESLTRLLIASFDSIQNLCIVSHVEKCHKKRCPDPMNSWGHSDASKDDDFF